MDSIILKKVRQDQQDILDFIISIFRKKTEIYNPFRGTKILLPSNFSHHLINSTNQNIPSEIKRSPSADRRMKFSRFHPRPPH